MTQNKKRRSVAGLLLLLLPSLNSDLIWQKGEAGSVSQSVESSRAKRSSQFSDGYFLLFFLSFPTLLFFKRRGWEWDGLGRILSAFLVWHYKTRPISFLSLRHIVTLLSLEVKAWHPRFESVCLSAYVSSQVKIYLLHLGSVSSNVDRYLPYVRVCTSDLKKHRLPQKCCSINVNDGRRVRTDGKEGKKSLKVWAKFLFLSSTFKMMIKKIINLSIRTILMNPRRQKYILY